RGAASEPLPARGSGAPARESAGPLAAALRALARLLGRTVDDGGLLARLETESFSQAASAVPLSTDLRSDAAGLLRRWVNQARRGRSSRAAHTAAIALLGLGLGAALAGTAHAATDSPLADGRPAYQEAMQLTGNASARPAA